MIWILFALVTAGVILAVARPLGRAAVPALSSASEIEAYRLQLADLDREQELGEIGNEEAEQTRTEISRRLLRASRQGAPAAFSDSPIAFKASHAFFALAAIIAAGTAGVYAIYGTPGLADQPIEARLSAPPSQQPMAIQITNVERRLRKDPNDPAGWAVIAPYYFASGQFDKAAEAYRKAIKLGGSDEEKLLGLYESLAYANEGTIPPEAKGILKTALAKTPKSLRARVWLAIQTAQEGKKAEAEQIYREILGENPPGAWKGLIFKQLAALKDEPEVQETAQPSGPAAQSERNPMVDALVERLATRLQQNPADLNGWLMLIRSYTALKVPDKAQEALAKARKQFESAPEALAQIDALLKELDAAGAGTESAAKAPASAPAGGRDAMIRGMVERLAARLKENGADLDGWLKLIRSYTVLKDTAKVQEAAATARKQFESDPKALEQIDALVKEPGATQAEAPAQPATTITQAPASAPAGDQSAMINGMVERLAARLKENGGDLNGWIMLIRSYTVLKDAAKAQEAATSARKQFASEPQALEQIDALMKELGAPQAEATAPAATSTQAPPASAPAAGQDAMIRGMVERLATRLKDNGADLNGWLMLIRSYTALHDSAKTQEAATSARKQFASEPQALEQIDALVKELGAPQTEATAPAAPATQASASTPEAGQGAMIRGMVERLATRLKENGADLDGWLRLIRSYTVLNETAKAQEAAVSARKQFESDPKALEQIETLTRELGVPAADGKGE
jgi:cytochrome c-type biogenesis protein CcmH